MRRRIRRFPAWSKRMRKAEIEHGLKLSLDEREWRRMDQVWDRFCELYPDNRVQRMHAMCVLCAGCLNGWATYRDREDGWMEWRVHPENFSRNTPSKIRRPALYARRSEAYGSPTTESTNQRLKSVV